MEQINNIQDRVNRILATIKETSSPKTIEYECELCQDTEWIINLETNSAKACVCKQKKYYKKLLDFSGISEAFLKMTFLNYIPKDKAQDLAKRKAMEYVRNFEKIRNTRQNSIMFSKQVGAGKTHLSIAICNELMNKFVGVRYMPYKEVVTYLKQIKTDEENYQREMTSYKIAPVLMIDDLFKLSERKGMVNEADLDIIYEIVNARYIKGMPMIISTEYDTDKLLETDQATGSRIIEMCKGRIIEFEGIELNERLR